MKAKIKSFLNKIKPIVKKLVSKDKLIFKIFAVVILAIFLTMGIVCVIRNSTPYAITVDGEKVCFVRGKTAAKKTIDKIVEKYIPEGTEIRATSTGGRLSTCKSSLSEANGKIISFKTAAEYIIETYQESKNPIKIKIASVKTEIEPYTPTPFYKKGKDMIVGEEKTIKKGKKGKQEVYTTYVSINGKVKSKKVTGNYVIDEGKRATVRKGILGLPKGADWRTYTGDPIYKDGKELVTTSMKYLGAPYKYGGYSLTHGIDCVQFVRQMYAKYGIKLPNNHYGLQHSGVGISYKNAKKGDIICYGGHVGIYIGNGKMINAVHKGVKVSRVKKGKIKAVRRVVK